MSDAAPEIERRSVETVLAEWLDRAAAELPIEDLDDEEILALCELKMTLSDHAELMEPPLQGSLL
jgi:hypothetical protein